MKHIVIGTAGHVDHGKTVLVKALTGTDTDRLKEEKERGISIELGFASFTLPSGIQAGIVDVPGHERFIKNMLAGIGGMDMVLLVVAADEGIMPQTREHLDIIDLLQIPQGIIVITKIDLVDRDWLELVREEVSELVTGTVLQDAPVAEVSAASGQGLKELVDLIDRIAVEIKERPVVGHARIPIDRVFSMTGFGTVVTGTMVEGRLRVGDTVQILPEGIESRVRGIQVHNRKVDTAEAGQRVAVNLAGIELEQIRRGSVLGVPGQLRTSYRLDARLKLLPGTPKPLANRARVRVHTGTAEVLARVILLEADELEPGRTALAQLECENPLVAVKGDRLVIRSYSPMRTIGGGKVIDPIPPKRKRLDPGVIEALTIKEKGTPGELLEQFMAAGKQVAFSKEELFHGLGLPAETAESALNTLVSRETVKQFASDGRQYYVLSSLYRQKAAELAETLEKFHASFPLRPGVSKEELRSKHFPGLNNKLFNALLDLYQHDGFIRIVGENIARHGFEPGPGPGQQKLFGDIEEKYLRSEYQTPGWEEIVSQFRLNRNDSEEILNFLINSRILLKLEDNILIHRKNLDRAKELILEFLGKNGEMTLAASRDLLKTSRKYALPIMNYFDREKITRRVEDKRVLY